MASIGSHRATPRRRLRGGGGISEDVNGLNFEPDLGVWDALRERRDRVAADQPAKLEFVWSVLGGAWTHKHKGVAFDSFQGRHSTASGEAWARSVSLPATASFSIRFYSEQGAQALAEAWADRMNAFFAIADGAVAYRFSEAEISIVSNSAEFEVLRQGATGQRRSRFDQVACLRPESRQA